MRLPVMPPVAPMLAKAVPGLPDGDRQLFEPKWDGFRCIVFRDGDDVELGSRNEKPLNRYFPEVIAAALAELPERCVLDGELVIPVATGLDFDALLQRIHPAASRARKLAEETPASFIAFDILCLDDRDLSSEPLAERRKALDEALADVAPPVFLSPATTERSVADAWFAQFEGAGLDGVVAKSLDEPYRPGERLWAKVKHKRTADCVVAGFRWHKSGDGVGSLLLGLYDADATLHSVGVASAFTVKRRRELVEELAPYRGEGALENHPWEGWADPAAASTGRMPGAPSRWNSTKDLSWEPLRVELVAEVAFDQLQGQRFRHAASFVRWRTDRGPASCRYDQLDVAAPMALTSVFADQEG